MTDCSSGMAAANCPNPAAAVEIRVDVARILEEVRVALPRHRARDPAVARALTGRRPGSILRRMSNYRTEDLERYAEVFQALANPHRLRILSRLATCCRPGTVSTLSEGRARVGELGLDLGIAPSTVSHHIKELRNAGLIKVERNGRTIECRVEPKILERLSRFFAFGE